MVGSKFVLPSPAGGPIYSVVCPCSCSACSIFAGIHGNIIKRLLTSINYQTVKFTLEPPIECEPVCISVEQFCLSASDQ